MTKSDIAIKAITIKCVYKQRIAAKHNVLAIF